MVIADGLQNLEGAVKKEVKQFFYPMNHVVTLLAAVMHSNICGTRSDVSASALFLSTAVQHTRKCVEVLRVWYIY